MADFIQTQNSFAHGEVSPEFFAKSNIDGLAKLENMDVLSGGGLTRRDGLKHVADLESPARLIPFSVSEDENYLLVLQSGKICIFAEGVKIKTLTSPWQYSDISKLQYAQRYGTMIFVHPDYCPQVLKKTKENFELSEFYFEVKEEDLSKYMPFIRFDDSENIKITISNNDQGSNYATLTTDQDFWTEQDTGNVYLIQGKQWAIYKYVSPTEVVAYVNGGYNLPEKPISDWYESAFSEKRGWPCSITFHQNRLVFGGSKSYPSGLWLSKVGKHNNFDTGQGLDDEAIFITLLSQQRQQICTVVSSDNLQILTTAGEWAISSKPLTPASVDIKQHTYVGSPADRYFPPQKIEGATVFISSNKKDIRELSLDELSENYNANDLCALSKHLMQNPIDIAYNGTKKQLYVVMQSGLMAVLNQNSALGISAWGTYATQGKFESVAVINDETFVITERQGEISLEKFSSDCLQDVDKYSFSFTASALPFKASGHNAKTIRIRKITVRILNTKTLFIKGHRIPLPNEVYEETSSGYSGDIEMNMIGTEKNCITSPWEIHSSENLPATILSVTIYGFYTV